MCVLLVFWWRIGVLKGIVIIEKCEEAHYCVNAIIIIIDRTANVYYYYEESNSNIITMTMTINNIIVQTVAHWSLVCVCEDYYCALILKTIWPNNSEKPMLMKETIWMCIIERRYYYSDERKWQLKWRRNWNIIIIEQWRSQKWRTEKLFIDDEEVLMIVMK